jgi:predicted kinase
VELQVHLSPSTPECLSLFLFPRTHQTLGSGKSTLARALSTTYPNFIRLSVDAYIFANHGLSGIDCPVPQHQQYQSEAQLALKAQFRQILKEGVRDVVLDFSFFNREYRDEWRDVISEETGRDGNEESERKVKVVLVYFDAEEDVLWRRIEERRVKAEKEGRGADDAVLVTRSMLNRYVKGFERPEVDEEAIVVKVE